MYKNPIIIHTSDNILVIVEELLTIYRSTDVSRHNYQNTMEILQCSRTTKLANKRGKEANSKRHQKSAKKGGVARILPNT